MIITISNRVIEMWKLVAAKVKAAIRVYILNLLENSACSKG